MTALLISLPWAAIVSGLLYALIHERDAFSRERAQLLQRIQAPDQAVIEHAAKPSEGPLFVSPFDDEAFHDLKDVA